MCLYICHIHILVHKNCLNISFSCDLDYKGITCNEPVIPHPTSLSENFENPTVLGLSHLMRIQGAAISYACGVLSSGKALVFDKAGDRHITTAEFNTTDVR